jgi:membrane protease YdiL (CAAX protease family)
LSPAISEPRRREFIKPLLGAGVCFIFFRLAFSVIFVVVEFFGGRMMALTLATLLAAAVSSAAAMAIFESRRLTDLGLAFREGWRPNVLIGAGMGAGAACLVVLLPVALGMARFQLVPNADISLGAAIFLPILLFCGAMGEEIAFRGFSMQYLAHGWGIWAAILTTSTIFGLLHGDNPGFSWMSGLNTVLFGILFGVGVFRTHELWLPIGMHFGWNVALPFLGATLSGLTIRVAGFECKWNTGANLYLSGGSYGPEASVLTTGMIGVMLVVLWRLPLSKGSAWLLDTAPGEEPAAQPES